MLLLNFRALLGQAKGKLFQPLQTNLRTRRGQWENQDSVGPFSWPKRDRTAPLAPAGQAGPTLLQEARSLFPIPAGKRFQLDRLAEAARKSPGR